MNVLAKITPPSHSQKSDSDHLAHSKPFDELSQLTFENPTYTKIFNYSQTKHLYFPPQLAQLSSSAMMG
jgi:hypothetical protein